MWKTTFKTIHQLSCFVGHPVSNALYRRRHLKLFTNWHVSWDTLYLMQYIEEVIQNFSPTVMFCGTPCMQKQRLHVSERYLSDIIAENKKP